MDLFEREVFDNTSLISAAVNLTNATARNQKLIKSMLLNMRLVSFMCNFWTIVLSLVSIV
jgi:hypothetical protein